MTKYKRVVRAPRKRIKYILFLGRDCVAYIKIQISASESELSTQTFPFLCTYFGNTKFLVAMRFGVTPVPIPNTMVKTETADDTILETVWESRWLPDL